MQSIEATYSKIGAPASRTNCCRWSKSLKWSGWRLRMQYARSTKKCCCHKCRSCSGRCRSCRSRKAIPVPLKMENLLHQISRYLNKPLAQQRVQGADSNETTDSTQATTTATADHQSDRAGQETEAIEATGTQHSTASELSTALLAQQLPPLPKYNGSSDSSEEFFKGGLHNLGSWQRCVSWPPELNWSTCNGKLSLFIGPAQSNKGWLWCTSHRAHLSLYTSMDTICANQFVSWSKT